MLGRRCRRVIGWSFGRVGLQDIDAIHIACTDGSKVSACVWITRRGRRIFLTALRVRNICADIRIAGCIRVDANFATSTVTCCHMIIAIRLQHTHARRQGSKIRIGECRRIRRTLQRCLLIARGRAIEIDLHVSVCNRIHCIHGTVFAIASSTRLNINSSSTTADIASCTSQIRTKQTRTKQSFARRTSSTTLIQAVFSHTMTSKLAANIDWIRDIDVSLRCPRCGSIFRENLICSEIRCGLSSYVNRCYMHKKS
mmetsp:Transcript_52152/g.86297  ORF Transcript_52152/g.86297 Transcript_52152/m.86297 type:complete len:255 (+) Transcript_52152:1021-1785(+)